MGTITCDRIRIIGGLGLVELKELEFCVEANQHATATISGRVDKKLCIEEWKESLADHVVKIMIVNEDGSELLQPIFSGYPKKAEFIEEAGYCCIKLEICSGTIALDREKKRRSFQDISQTYEKIVENTINETPQASVICTEGKKQTSSKPLIQYMETDWDYILRLASHMNSMVFPEVRQPRPRFWFGMPQTSKHVLFSNVTYESGISKRYHELGGSQSGYKQSDFLYYQVDSTEDYEIGVMASFEGKKLKICKKSAKLIRSELIFTYVLGKEELVSMRRRYNPVFAGMSILGKVLSVNSETLKLHLDIDKEQDEGTAYSYEWIPDTGSIMYCMPKVGTTVSLYFSNEEESSARAVSCVRTNGDSCTAMSDSNQKGLTTDYGKQMYLNSTSLGFSAKESGLQLKMEDDSSVLFESHKDIIIQTLGAIRFTGKTVSLKTPVEMKMARKK